MDQIFDRLGNLLRSMFQETESDIGRDAFSGDPDMQQAWEELDDFLKSDAGPSRSTRQQAPPKPHLSPEMRKAYDTLQIDSDASMEVITSAYRRLIRKHHPDRFAEDPKQMARATEITKNINFAYQLIKKSRQSGSK